MIQGYINRILRRWSNRKDTTRPLGNTTQYMSLYLPEGKQSWQVCPQCHAECVKVLGCVTCNGKGTIEVA